MLSAKDLHKFFNTRQGNQGEKIFHAEKTKMDQG